MEKFAKLFEYEDIGQIAVVFATNEENAPEISIFFKPEELGVCQIKSGYKDTDDGWDKAEEIFNNMTKESAKKTVLKAIGIAPA